MKSPEEIARQLGKLMASDKEDLQSVVNDINAILEEDKDINLEVIEDLEDCEQQLRIIKNKFLKRLIHLLKTNHMV